MSLVRHIDCSKIARNLAREQKLAGARSPSIFESVILKNNEPSERYEIDHNHVWPHQVEHILFTLHMVHQS